MKFDKVVAYVARHIIKGCATMTKRNKFDRTFEQIKSDRTSGVESLDL